MFGSNGSGVARKMVVAGALSCALAFSMLGCAGQQSEPQPEPEPEVTYRVLGVEDEDALSMNFANETGKDIVSLVTKPVSAQTPEYGANLLEDEGQWQNGETITLFCDAYDVVESAEGSEGAVAADIELLPTYDLQMTFSDGAAIVLHEVTFDEVEEVQVHLDEASGLGYMTYDVDGKETSTLQTEIAVKEAEDAAAAAALQAQQEAEAAAAAAAEQTAQQNSSSGTSRSYNYSSGNSGNSSGSGSGAGQSQDSCISPDDLVLNE